MNHNTWTQLNFGATIWLFFGVIAILLGMTASTPIDWSFVYVACIVVLSIKMLLIFATNEILSLQHLVQ